MFSKNKKSLIKVLKPRKKMSRNIADISRIGDEWNDFSWRYVGGAIFCQKSAIYRQLVINRRFIQKVAWEALLLPIYRRYIVDFLAIFSEKSPLSVQRDLTTQITPVLIWRPDLNPNVNKENQTARWLSNCNPTAIFESQR